MNVSRKHYLHACLAFNPRVSRREFLKQLGGALTIRKNSGITKPTDFKGKTLANHSKLSVHYLINMMYLESYGLKYNEDVYDKIPTEVLRKAFTPGRSDFTPFPYQSSAQLLIGIMKRYALLDNAVDGASVAREVFQSDLSRQIMFELEAQPPATNYRVEKILDTLKEYTG